MNKKIVIGAILFIAIASAVTKWSGGHWASIKNNDQSPADAAVSKNALTLDKQTPGSVVSVSSAVLEKKGFVVIHEKDGELFGKIIGSSVLLESGESNNISITLREPLQTGKSYLAVIDVDNGDGRYMPGIDHPVPSKDGSGEPFSVGFSPF